MSVSGSDEIWSVIRPVPLGTPGIQVSKVCVRDWLCSVCMYLCVCLCVSVCLCMGLFRTMWACVDNGQLLSLTQVAIRMGNGQI